MCVFVYVCEHTHVVKTAHGVGVTLALMIFKIASQARIYLNELIAYRKVWGGDVVGSDEN